MKTNFDDGLLENSTQKVFAEAFLPRRTLINYITKNNYIYIQNLTKQYSRAFTSRGQTSNKFIEWF